MRLFAAWVGGRRTRGQWHSPASGTSPCSSGRSWWEPSPDSAADQPRPHHTVYPGAFRDQLCFVQEEWVTAWRERLEGGRDGPEQKSRLISPLVFWEAGPPSLGTGVMAHWDISPPSECSSPPSSFPHPPSRGDGEGNAVFCSLLQSLTSNSHFAKSRAVLTFSRFSLSLFSSSRISNIFCTLESVEN